MIDIDDQGAKFIRTDFEGLDNEKWYHLRVKALMIGETGKEEILFLRQMDQFLEILRDFEGDNTTRLQG